MKSRYGTTAILTALSYAVQIGADLWVVHAFQKKSKKGISTPKRDIDVIKRQDKRAEGE